MSQTAAIYTIMFLALIAAAAAGALTGAGLGSLVVAYLELAS